MRKQFCSFEWIFGTVAVILLCLCGLFFHSGLQVVACACLGIVGSVINGKGRKECYFFLLSSSLLYAFNALTSKNYGESILNFAFVSPMFLYSILRWYRPRKQQQKKDVFTLQRKTMLLLCVCMLALGTAYGFALRYFGSNLPFLNAASTIVAIAANYLSARRMKEQWYTQLISNAVLITLWLITSLNNPGNLPLMLQNILFVVSNLRGAVLWTKMSRETVAEGATA